MSDAKLCGECGCIHRPGENTLCPGWRPGPFVPDEAPKLLPDVEIPSGWEVIERATVSNRIAFRRAGSGYRYITLEVMRDLAATVGLALVPAADVPTPEERAVLAFADCVDWSGDGYGPDRGQLELIAEAFHALQMARRAAKEAKG